MVGWVEYAKFFAGLLSTVSLIESIPAFTIEAKITSDFRRTGY